MLCYYALDLQSNQGGGDFAPVKMQTLRMYRDLFPNVYGTGQLHPLLIRSMLNRIGLRNAETIELYERLSDMVAIDKITKAEWEILKNLGITHWYGGIRIPYGILVTDVIKPFLDSESAKQFVKEEKGEIRITFSGAKEWQATFFCFRIFERLQGILNSLRSSDQIWYDLRGFQDDPCLQFWVKALDITEAPED